MKQVLIGACTSTSTKPPSTSMSTTFSSAVQVHVPNPKVLYKYSYKILSTKPVSKYVSNSQYRPTEINQRNMRDKTR